MAAVLASLQDQDRSLTVPAAGLAAAAAGPTGAGFYVHIPFCEARCSYCDFAIFTGQSRQFDAYLSALDAEIARYHGQPIQSLFIGGGTPTVLSHAQIRTLLTSILSHLDCGPLIEASVEANPEHLSAEDLSAWRAGGINRLSFGLQTTDDGLLKKLGRLHTFDGFLTAWKTARSVGFDNMNVDLIFGLPGQTTAGWNDTLARVIAISPEHISAYALKIEPGTRFAKQRIELDDERQSEMYLAASAALTKAGYVHYEISNFAKPGRESIHNKLYWKNADTIGVGVSAASYVGGVRRTNTRNLIRYLGGKGRPEAIRDSEERLTDGDRLKENVMLGLRLNEGVPQDVIQSLNEPEFDRFLARNLAFVEKGMYCLTPQGWLVSNQLFHQLV